jgi:hypothetical protein
MKADLPAGGDEAWPDEPIVDTKARQQLVVLSGFTRRTSKLEALRRFQEEISLAHQMRESQDRRAWAGASLQAVARLVHRLGLNPEYRAMFSELITVLVDADNGVVSPLVRPRRWRKEGRKPLPTAEQTIRELAVEVSGVLMELGMKEIPATDAVGVHLEQHGFPVRRAGNTGAARAATPGATVRKWRERMSVASKSGFPNARLTMHAQGALLRSMPPDQAHKVVLDVFDGLLDDRGYRRRK